MKERQVNLSELFRSLEHLRVRNCAKPYVSSQNPDQWARRVYFKVFRATNQMVFGRLMGATRDRLLYNGKQWI